MCAIYDVNDELFIEKCVMGSLVKSQMKLAGYMERMDQNCQERHQEGRGGRRRKEDSSARYKTGTSSMRRPNRITILTPETRTCKFNKFCIMQTHTNAFFFIEMAKFRI